MTRNSLILGILLLLAVGVISSAAMANNSLRTVDNAYCDVPTYVQAGLNDVAMALPLATTQGHHTILVDERALRLPHLKYIMAHECCHHSLHHTQSMPYEHSRETLEQLELQADQCAAQLLKNRGEFDVIQAAIDSARRNGQMERARFIDSSANVPQQSAYGFE